MKTHYKVTIIGRHNISEDVYTFSFVTFASSKDEAVENVKRFYDLSYITIYLLVADAYSPDAYLISAECTRY